MNKRLVLPLLTALGLAITSHFAVAHTVTDDAGNQVEVAPQALRIADGWYAHHSLLMTLGAGDRIVATVNHARDRPWMFKIQPSLHQALSVPGRSFNSETLLVRKVDTVFVAAEDGDAAAYRQAGLPTLVMRFDDFPSMKHSLLTTAEVVGTDRARQRAKAYNAYLDQQVTRIAARTDKLSEQQRPRVLHIQSLHPLKVDGRNTLIDSWIRLAGGRNAAAEVDGNMKETSAENVLFWQPDVIIIGAGAGSIAGSDYASLFSNLKAVKNHQVWQNPAGVFPWDRYGTEAALQIQWAAATLHPELFADLNMVQATQDFYQRFFDYQLTASDAKRILQALPPG
ncbi:ABC transporter substrate-binding protein [Erwiniaceae bacterium BAC15a-03b]|uniref:ABC transporter substrate-binding protein n=1 Tax=Winslowiella arboricola TaxID=2978220 RepID=A0A9J6PVY0_9GAMM|nr:ABC transporter substrate-binding protein [Winslowiella arboricola]MCU5775486.1 ABC transporter substrate-binding protein [Winslowiella arboricola]MCU5779664.1 ABC transporter substrate-binding protein [Winslowiella arboricola]